MRSFYCVTVCVFFFLFSRLKKVLISLFRYTEKNWSFKFVEMFLKTSLYYGVTYGLYISSTRYILFVVLMCICMCTLHEDSCWVLVLCF